MVTLKGTVVKGIGGASCQVHIQKPNRLASVILI